MTKVRQDAWSTENDLLLAETVLRHIREGSTQLNAFEEVGDVLNRTSAACGFRWNAVVRNQYKQAIELAKRQRKENKRAQKVTWKQPYKLATKQSSESNDATRQKSQPGQIKDIIAFLEQLHENYEARSQSFEQFHVMQEQNKVLTHENNTLKKQLTDLQKRLQTVETDYQTFIQIMDRARKLALLEENEDKPSPMFKMDKNGNLEQFMQG